jgi:hypothetical protein
MSIPTITTVTSISTSTLTQHALLVLWGQFAQYLALPQALPSPPCHCTRKPTLIPHTSNCLSFWSPPLNALPPLASSPATSPGLRGNERGCSCPGVPGVSVGD